MTASRHPPTSSASDAARVHLRAAGTHHRAADLHEAAANLHEQHAAEMYEFGYIARAERAERRADRERELANRERLSAERERDRALETNVDPIE
jgi:hypothetical protein